MTRTISNAKQVVEGSPADLAGLCVGDVIVKCGGEDLSSAPEVSTQLALLSLFLCIYACF